MKERFPMKWMFLFLLMMPVYAVAQNTVVVKVETAEIKAQAKEGSRTLRSVEQGTQLEYTGTISGWLILKNGGFISRDDVSTLEAFTIDGGKILDKETVLKDPSEYTEKELLYLLLQEQRKSDDLKSDVRTIKNIQIAFAVLTAVSVVANIILLSSL